MHDPLQPTDIGAINDDAPASPNSSDDELIQAATCRKMAGNISSMTEWRWRRAGLLPEPVQIRSRNYYRKGEFMRALRNLGTSATE